MNGDWLVVDEDQGELKGEPNERTKEDEGRWEMNKRLAR